MKPILLEVCAFGPYSSSQKVDFARLGEHGLFLIHGATGSGKSSLLDAMCFALFGDDTSIERKGQDFVTTLGSTELTKVTLEFEHAGRRYRVCRYPTQERAKKRGKGSTVQPTEGHLVDLDTGEELATKATDVTRCVQEMLRCTVAQFRQTVLLPQGEFRKVVTDSKTRRQILAGIFDTGRFSVLASRLKETAAALDREGEANEKERRNILAGLAVANEQELRERLESAVRAEGEAEDAKSRAAHHKDECLKAKLAGDDLQRSFDELAELRVREARLAQDRDRIEAIRTRRQRAQRAALLQGDSRHLETRRKDLRSLEDQASEARERLERAEEDHELARQACEELEARRPELARAEEEYGLLKALKPQVDGLEQKLERRAVEGEKLETAEERVRLYLEKVADGERRLQGLAAERKTLKLRLKGETAARERLATAEGKHQALQRVGVLQAEVRGLAHQITVLEGEESGLATVTAAVRHHASGLLAATLTDGEECPVCGSTSHPKPASVGEEAAALEEALAAYREAASELATLQEQLDGRTRSLRELLELHGWQERLPEASLLSDELQAAGEEVEQMDLAESRLEELDLELEELEGILKSHRENLEAAKGETAEAKGRLEGVAGEISGALGGLAPEHRDPRAFALALARARELHEDLLKRFQEAEGRLGAADAGLQKTASRLEFVAGSIKKARQSLVELEEGFTRRLAQEGFTDGEQFESALIDVPELERLDSQVDEYDDAVKELGGRLGALEEKLRGKAPPDLELLSERLTKAEQDYRSAEAAWSEARDIRKAVEKECGRFSELERLDQGLSRRRKAAKKLSELANGKLTGRSKVDFETFVLQSIFHQVLEAGNHYLKHMTGGRYAMLLRMDGSASSSGLELDVLDNASGGEARPIHTLSGGEGFLASLALALGMSEIAQRQSGGVELGALFVDEGFGSLDGVALDQAVEILRSLREEHRMVGIISHVEELKRRVPVQLLVERGEEGSTVTPRFNA